MIFDELGNSMLEDRLIAKRKVIGGKFLTDADVIDLHGGERRVEAMMRDEEFHSVEEIKMIAGNGKKPAKEGERRYRSVRAKLLLEGFQEFTIRDGRTITHYRLRKI